MLVVYKTGAIRVTPKFTRMVVAALFGVLVLMLGNFVLAMFDVGGGTGLGLRSGGTMAIIFSLVCIGIAAFSFLIDFDAADQMIRARSAGEGGVGHRAGPDRDPGLAVPRDPASAQLPAERLADTDGKNRHADWRAGFCVRRASSVRPCAA